MMRTAIVLVMLAAARAHAGDCADSGLVATVLTPANTTIDQEGGIVVGLIDSPTARDIPDLANTPWRFHEGKGRDKPKVTLLAPGLAVFAPKAFEKAMDLEDANQKALVHVAFEFATYLDMPVDAAPKLTAATMATTVTRRSTDYTTTIKLAAPAPANAIALIVLDAKGVATSWGRIAPGATAIVVWRSFPCHGEAKGTVGARHGDKVSVEYVNTQGHRSLPSASITVGDP